MKAGNSFAGLLHLVLATMPGDSERLIIVIHFRMSEYKGSAGGRGHGAIGTPDRTPDDFIELIVISGVFLGEVHFLRYLTPPTQFRILFVQIKIFGHTVIGAEIGLSLKRFVHRGGRK